MPAPGVPLSVPVPLPLSTNTSPAGSGAPPRVRDGAGNPLVVTVNDPAAPTVNVALAALVIAGAVAWGLGCSLGFPVGMSAAAEGPHSAARVSAVATLGYVAFLVGPPLLGFLGEHFGLRGAMIVVLAVVVLASFLTSAAKPQERQVTPAGP